MKTAAACNPAPGEGSYVLGGIAGVGKGNSDSHKSDMEKIEKDLVNSVF